MILQISEFRRTYSWEEILAVSSAMKSLKVYFFPALDFHFLHFYKIWKTVLDATIYTSNMSLRSVSEHILT